MTEPSKELTVQRDTELDRYARLGQWLAASESGGQDVKALGASAALRLFYAHELGLPPLAAAELSVIKGRLFVQAKLLRALASRHGYRVVRTDSDDRSCTAVLIDADSGEEIGRSTFTIDDAKKAGLIRERSAWTTHPARMLWARASKFVLDDYAPEVTLGLGTEDEAAEIEGRPAPPETGDPDDLHDVEFEEVDPGTGVNEMGAPDSGSQPAPPPTPSRDELAAFYKPEDATPRQIDRIKTLLKEKQGVTDPADQLEVIAYEVQRELASLEELGMAEATKVIADLHEKT